MTDCPEANYDTDMIPSIVTFLFNIIQLHNSEQYYVHNELDTYNSLYIHGYMYNQSTLND